MINFGNTRLIKSLLIRIVTSSSFICIVAKPQLQSMLHLKLYNFRPLQLCNLIFVKRLFRYDHVSSKKANKQNTNVRRNWGRGDRFLHQTSWYWSSSPEETKKIYVLFFSHQGFLLKIQYQKCGIKWHHPK